MAILFSDKYILLVIKNMNEYEIKLKAPKIKFNNGVLFKVNHPNILLIIRIVSRNSIIPDLIFSSKSLLLSKYIIIIINVAKTLNVPP